MKKTVTCTLCGIGCRMEVSKTVSCPFVIDYMLSNDTPNRGGKLCSRGNLIFEYVKSKRIKRPLKTTENGNFVEISWQRAVEEIVLRLSEISKDNPEKIGFLSGEMVSNESAYLFQKLARLLGTNNVDSTAAVSHAVSIRALNETNAWKMWAPFSGIEQSDLVIIWGFNPAGTAPVLLTWLVRAKEKGARIIVVDPRLTSVEKLVDSVVQPLPGTDVFLALSILNVVVNMDPDASSRLSPEALRLISLYPPEKAEEITGVSADTIISIAREIELSSSGVLLWGSGITMTANGYPAVLALITLATLTRFSIIPMGRYSNSQGVIDMGITPYHLPGYTDYKDAEPFLKAWLVGDINRKEGLSLVEMLSRGLSAFYILNTDIVAFMPHAERALKRAEFVVFQSAFQGETMEFADIVLPSALLLESGGTTTNSEGRVQWCERVKRPPGETRADFEIIAQLGRGMKLPGFSYAFPEEILREISLLVPGYPEPKDVKNKTGGVLIPRRKMAVRPKIEPPLNFEGKFRLLITGQSMRFLPEVIKRESVAKINREDASLLGLEDGGMVTVETEAGMATFRVDVTSSIPRNTLVVPWSDELRRIIPLKISKWSCLELKSLPCVVRKHEEDIH